jgi:alcohol dehydrogenase YqhD (iron-dependent ADH family)
MVEFYFEHPVKVYSGEGVTAKYLKNVLKDYGKNVMLCFGKGSVKKNGVYDEIINILSEAGKTVIEFSGICQTPLIKKCKKAQILLKKIKSI